MVFSSVMLTIDTIKRTFMRRNVRTTRMGDNPEEFSCDGADVVELCCDEVASFSLTRAAPAIYLLDQLKVTRLSTRGNYLFTMAELTEYQRTISYLVEKTSFLLRK